MPAWSQAELERLIIEQIEESRVLEYKRAASLGRQDKQKEEITKDVSAFANSAGGTIVYGLAEFADEERKHLPEKLDPLDRTQFSREWLDQIIGNIQPRIDGLAIHPVPLDSDFNHVAYVIEIPQSSTAHQATDKKYYRRYNFRSVPMDDYEIRDIMGRQKHPNIDLTFELHVDTEVEQQLLPMPFADSNRKRKNKFTLVIHARNTGTVLAQYVNAWIYVPPQMARRYEKHERQVRRHGDREFLAFYRENTTRDILEGGPPLGRTVYGPKRYDPILPGRTQVWEIELTRKLNTVDLDSLHIEWSVYADNAQLKAGEIALNDIKQVDLRERTKGDEDFTEEDMADL
jgi:Putative DNA-binding domain